MKSLNKALKAYAALTCAYWLPQLYGVMRLSGVPTVEGMSPETERTDWPRVSVIITACNEEDTIEAAVRPRLDDDYPELEIVLIDDRSTDGTGTMIDRLAEEDPRITPIHVDELPHGWLGKLHAMDVGVRAASGDWLLFSDADVQVRAGTLGRTVAYSEENGVDHMAILPDFLPAGFILDAAISNFARIMCVLGRMWAVSNPGSRAAAGSGSFNMVRRETLEATEGLEYLKLEVSDDVTIGQMLKASGARQAFAKGNGWVAVCFYPTIQDALVGSERALFTALGGCSMWCCIGIGVGFVGLELAPLVLGLQKRNLKVRRLGRALMCVQIAVSLVFDRWFERPLCHAPLAPLGSAAIMGAFIRAGVLGAARGGIQWRGTFYPTSLLKSGRRFKL